MGPTLCQELCWKPYKNLVAIYVEQKTRSYYKNLINMLKYDIKLDDSKRIVRF